MPSYGVNIVDKTDLFIEKSISCYSVLGTSYSKNQPEDSIFGGEKVNLEELEIYGISHQI